MALLVAGAACDKDPTSETAWGRLAGGGPYTYVGIDDDLRDFPARAVAADVR